MVRRSVLFPKTCLIFIHDTVIADMFFDSVVQKFRKQFAKTARDYNTPVISWVCIISFFMNGLQKIFPPLRWIFFIA